MPRRTKGLPDWLALLLKLMHAATKPEKTMPTVKLSNSEATEKYQKYAKSLDRILFVVMILLTATVTMVICMLMVFGFNDH